MKHQIIYLILVCFSMHSVAQTKEIIKLWPDGHIPFNKEKIDLQEKLDAEGKRYSQISEPLLFVYRNDEDEMDGPALLFCPGGGYAVVAIGKDDGEQTARKFLEMGFNTVAILKYRLPDSLIVNSQEKVPLCDAQKALSMMHTKASEWKVDPKKIAVMGGSAGGHLAASLATLSDEIIAPDVSKDQLEFAVSILMYPVISFNEPYRHKGSYKKLLGNELGNQELLDYYSLENQVSTKTPPTFLVHAKDDVGVSYQNSLMYCNALNEKGVKCKYVELEKGGHGFGLSIKRTGVDWTIPLKTWLVDEVGLLEW